MATISDYVLDAALSKLDTEANRIDITTTEASSYAEATTLPTATPAGKSLGNSTSLSFGAPTNGDTSGRKVTAAAITDGSVTYTGNAAYYAITDTSNSRLLATGSLTTSQAVTSGNSFTIAAFDVEIPDPA